MCGAEGQVAGGRALNQPSPDYRDLTSRCSSLDYTQPHDIGFFHAPKRGFCHVSFSESQVLK